MYGALLCTLYPLAGALSRGKRESAGLTSGAPCAGYLVREGGYELFLVIRSGSLATRSTLCVCFVRRYVGAACLVCCGLATFDRAYTLAEGVLSVFTYILAA